MNGEVMTDENMPVVLGDDNLIKIAEAAEKRIEAIKKIKQAALSVTSKHDWVDQGGKPYLQASGGEKVGRTFGISWRIDEPVLTAEEDGNYSYTYKGYFTLGSATVEVIGSRGTKDPFFSRAHGADKPISEIDRNDVKKAALTNLIGNGITRILGIRNLTWEELEAAGINRGTAGKVEYGKAEMSAEGKDLRAEIEKMLLEMAGNSKVEMAKMLMKFTSFIAKDGKEVQGKSNISDLSEKAIPVTYGKIVEVYTKWKESNPPKDTSKEGEVNASGNLFG